VVRAVGGLDDTVQDADEVSRGGTGFKFREYSADALVAAVGRALDAYRNPRRWKALQRSAMAEDHSWDVSAREYVKVYRGIETRKDTDGIRKGTDADRRQLRTGDQRRTGRAR
jgi:starch synthase